MANSEKKRISNGSMCSILCGDPIFWRFLNWWVRSYTEVEIDTFSKEKCTKAVYWLFEIESRSELNEGAAAVSWRRIHKEFKRWKQWHLDL